VFLFFALDDRKSFDHLPLWHAELVQHNPSCCVAVVGTKSDLRPPSPLKIDGQGKGQGQAVSSIEGKEFAEGIGATYCECSSLTGENVETAVILLVAQIRNKIQGEVLMSQGRAPESSPPTATASPKKQSCIIQ
jgi:GTPase SAR1 family protein